MKITNLNEEFIQKLNESSNLSEIKLRVQNHLWNSIEDLIDGLTMDVASNVSDYDPNWCMEALDPSSAVKMNEAKQHLIDVMMNLLFAYAEDMSESYDKEGNPERCDRCDTLLNDMGTCPKCDDGEEDYEDK